MEKAGALIKLPLEISGQPEPDFGCHIQDKIEDKILSCNAEGQPALPQAYNQEQSQSGLESGCQAETEAHQPKTLRADGRVVYELASEELKMNIDIENGGTPDPNPSLFALEAGVSRRLREIGTTSSAWEEAINVLGLNEAILAGLVVDARLTDQSQTPILRPGAYFRGMVRARLNGELNLMGSFMGLLQRRGMEEEKRCREKAL